MKEKEEKEKTKDRSVPDGSDNKQVAVVAFGLSGGSLLSSTNRSFQGRSTPVSFMSM